VLAPAELVRLAREVGLDALALTDHDSLAGLDEARQAGAELGVEVIAGVELSVRNQTADEHLLGFFVDPYAAELVAYLENLQVTRQRMAEETLAALERLGAPVDPQRVAELARGAVVTRPHIARALVEAGVVDSVDAAFATLLHPRSPHYVAKRDTDVREGIALVRAAGGVPVFAHGLATKRGRVVDDGAIAAMAEAGLLGLEVDHPDHSEEERAHLRGLAGELGLIATGSSDYHGANKTTPIGACLTAPDQLEALLAAGTGTRPLAG
jgi:predicted metal-dependent phosphoesterase TrpH